MSSDLDVLFRPGSVAVVGASATATKIGGRPVDFLKRFGYQGRIFPINPRADEIQGLRAWPTLVAVGEPIDLAVFAVPEALLESAIEDAIAAGVRAGVIFTAGLAEVSAEGAALQAKLAARMHEAGMRAVGPNCLGIMNPRTHAYATFSPAPEVGLVKPGVIGLASQSGAFGAYAFTLARERGIGLSLWVSTGNEADVQIADCITWLARDPETKVIMAYMEGCRDGERLREALSLAHAAGKPVVVVKIGRTALGAQAAMSHTAALAGDDAAYDAMFRQYGVYRARDVEDFFNVAQAAAVAGLPRTDSVALFTLSGGVGAFMADEASDHGLRVPELNPAAQARILEMVPFAAPRNPIDITGQIGNDRSMLLKACRILLEPPSDYGALLGFMAAAGATEHFWPDLQDLVLKLRQEYPDTLLAISTLLKPERRDWLLEHGALFYAEPAAAVRTLAALARLAQGLGRPVPPTLAACPPASISLDRGALDEPSSLRLLERAGIPVVPARVAASADEACALASGWIAEGRSVAVKVVSPQILHKTDVGGVRLGLADRDAVARAFAEVTGNAHRAVPDATIEGALVAPMVSGGVECILGARNDPVFGPLIMFGLGGAFVEVLRDVSFRIAPVSRDEALAMIREVKAFPLLDGARGRPRCDVSAIADALVALSDLALATRDTLDSIDINPFVSFAPGQGLGGRAALALDAVVVGRG
jgi:acyl-CoA synthetase (NDP forming)